MSAPRWLTTYSKSLRRESTDAEQALWREIRARRFHGLRFRRQQPVGTFIADFCCFEIGLIIELDGGQHDEAKLVDAERTGHLERHGFVVVRYWNNEVLFELPSVLEDLERVVLDLMATSSGDDTVGEPGAPSYLAASGSRVARASEIPSPQSSPIGGGSHDPLSLRERARERANQRSRQRTSSAARPVSAEDVIPSEIPSPQSSPIGGGGHDPLSLRERVRERANQRPRQRTSSGERPRSAEGMFPSEIPSPQSSPIGGGGFDPLSLRERVRERANQRPRQRTSSAERRVSAEGVIPSEIPSPQSSPIGGGSLDSLRERVRERANQRPRQRTSSAERPRSAEGMFPSETPPPQSSPIGGGSLDSLRERVRERANQRPRQRTSSAQRPQCREAARP